MNISGGIIIILIGIGSFFFTEKMWKFEHFLDTKGGEPSELYIAMGKISGVILMVLGVVMMVGIW